MVHTHSVYTTPAHCTLHTHRTVCVCMRTHPCSTPVATIFSRAAPPGSKPGEAKKKGERGRGQALLLLAAPVRAPFPLRTHTHRSHTHRAPCTHTVHTHTCTHTHVHTQCTHVVHTPAGRLAQGLLHTHTHTDTRPHTHTVTPSLLLLLLLLLLHCSAGGGCCCAAHKWGETPVTTHTQEGRKGGETHRECMHVAAKPTYQCTTPQHTYTQIRGVFETSHTEEEKQHTHAHQRARM